MALDFMWRIRVDDNDRSRIRLLAEHYGLSESVIIRELVRDAATRLANGQQLSLFHRPITASTARTSDGKNATKGRVQGRSRSTAKKK